MHTYQIDELIKTLEEAKRLGYVVTRWNTKKQVIGDVNIIDYDISMVGKTDELRERQHKEIEETFI